MDTIRLGWAVVALLLVSTPSAGATIDGGPAAWIRLAQAEGPVIEAPRRITTDQATIDFTGRVTGLGSVMLSVNGDPVMVDADGSFHVRRVIPVGLTRLMLIAEDIDGGQTEHRILVKRRIQAAETVDFGDYHALVIGNNDYRDLTDLETAKGDAEAVAVLLAERYGFEVEVLINATRYDIISALGALRAALTETDNLLIYYAGHGALDVDSDEGYWLPVDAERDNVANWLSNATITSQIKAMRAKHVMIIADSCYSGKLTRGAETAIKTGGERSAWLTRMAARRSRTALTSGGLEPVLDAGGGGHSVFAKALLEALGENTRVLDGQSLFDAIKRPIVVNADQTPEYADVRKAGHDGGDFLFVPVGVTSVTPIAETTAPATADETARVGAVDTQAVELAYWQSIQNSADPAMFAAYLAEFPDGTFAGLAKLKRDTLLPSVVPDARIAPTASATDEAIPPPPPESPRIVAAVDPDRPKATVKDQYNDAHRLLQAGKFGKAREAFEAFIEAHPKDDLTDNAYYWLGESYFSSKNYKSAARIYARGFDRFPKADKAPALLLKLAAALAKSNEKSDACKIFKNFAKAVPKSSRDEKKQAKTLAKRMGCR